MTLIIELTPDKEQALRAEANRRGIPVVDYARAVLEESLSIFTSTKADVEEFESTLNELAGIAAIPFK